MRNLDTYRIRFAGLVSMLIFLHTLPANICVAQDSSTATIPFNQAIEQEKEKEHSPKLATALSAALPGLGQVYNKKYWKVPIIYAGVGALVYSISINSSRYKMFKNAYALRIDGDPTTIDIFDLQLDNGEPKYLDESLLNLKDFYRRNRDVSYIFMGVLYMLNIVDAAVDAHFFNFEISDDLSLELRPSFMYVAGNGQATGIGLTLSL
ncbi:MAG: hypothetical protein JKY52_16770 [Flavobacteriales bacterium]|nr:hypothetical protein [Flavobacteriales bacterium]